jgi:hypothetical protein
MIVIIRIVLVDPIIVTIERIASFDGAYQFCYCGRNREAGIGLHYFSLFNETKLHSNLRVLKLPHVPSDFLWCFT